VREEHCAGRVHERLARVRERLADGLDRSQVRVDRAHEVAAGQREIMLEGQVEHSVAAPRSGLQPVEIVEGGA
jgi:hypothetical protein